jgi:ketosteroid isomerase-like protein
MRIFVAAVLLALPTIAAAQTTTRNEAAEREVAKLERELQEARFRNDVAAVNGYLAPDYYRIDSEGQRSEVGNQGKGPYNTTPNGTRWEKVELRDQRVRVYGDTAVSTFLRNLHVRTQDGSSRQSELVGTHVWVRREGRWQAVLSQATQVLK